MSMSVCKCPPVSLPVLRRSYQISPSVPTTVTQHMEVQFSRADAVEFLSQRYAICPGTNLDYTYDNMTFEELNGEYTQERMDSVAKALEEVLMSALPQGCITVGVYEAAKSLNVDPDNVVLCILAADDEDVKDVALQIHFTLIQAFCCENDINILRVNSTRRLAQILCGGAERGRPSGGEPVDLHCVLVTSPHSNTWKDPALSKVNRFCSESRCMDQWVPIINLPDR